MQQNIYTPTGNAFNDVKVGKPVWGETVTVPEHSDPPKDPTTSWTRENGDGKVQQGNGTNSQENKQQGGDDTITEPIVVLPDGTKVTAKSYFAEAFTAKETELTQKESRLDGMLELTRNGNGNDNAGGEGGDPNPNQNGDETNVVSFEKMTFPEDTVPEENEKFIVGEYNKVVDTLNTREELWAAKDAEKQAAIDKLSKDFKKLSDVVGQDKWQNSIAKVTAITGLSEEELISKYKETRVADAEVLSTLILGEREKERILKEATNQADQERQNGNNAVGGQSAGSGGGGTQTDNRNVPGRGLDLEKDYDAEKLVTKYNLISYDPYQQSA